MKPLDITTPRGRIAAQDQHDAMSIIKRSMPGIEIVETSDTDRAYVDAFAIRESRIVAAFEVKSRDMTREQLSQYDDEWLVTFDKVIGGANIAHSLCIPFFGVLYLVPDKVVMLEQLADKDGSLMPEMRVLRSRTQATCNGGVATRVNAFIDMRNAKVIQ